MKISISVALEVKPRHSVLQNSVDQIPIEAKVNDVVKLSRLNYLTMSLVAFVMNLRYLIDNRLLMKAISGDESPTMLSGLW